MKDWLVSAFRGSGAVASAPDASEPTGDTLQTVHHVHSKDVKTFFLDLLLSVAASALMYFVTKKTLESMNPDRKSAEAAADIKKIMERIARCGRVKTGDLRLNSYESTIVGEVALPADIGVKFDDIGGLLDLKNALIETVLMPLSHPELYAKKDSSGVWRSRKLVAPPKGVLFYGPPGTGKTMAAKAIAKDSGATFINLRWSTIKNKWYGESQKLIRAVFSLAHKLAPTIVFVDEAECFLGQRGGQNDHSENNALKAEFMSLWDGLRSDDLAVEHGHVVVLCATNRPWELDEAILRRMPRNFEFELPNLTERTAILQVLLAEEALGEDVSVQGISDLTENYSGSDLKELCRYAAMNPIREALRAQRKQHIENESEESKMLQPRLIEMADFAVALENIKPSGSSARKYQFKRFSQLSKPEPVEVVV